MKRCSVCDRTVADDKLSFCVTCGGVLVVEAVADEPAYDPFKTMVATPRPSIDVPGASEAPTADVPFAAEPIVNPSWDQIASKFDTPATGVPPSTGLALGAMICGLVALLCGVTAFLGPVAAIMGFVALRKQSAEPMQYGGRSFALVGIVTGILATLVMLGGLVVLVVMLVSGYH